MRRNLWKSCLIASLLLSIGMTAAVAESLASEEISELDQITSVSQLADVKPTDWAFQALQSLAERYGCMIGYPNRTGNRALTRSEFAAGLNACMDRINQLTTAAIADLVRREDLLTLQKLQEEFAAELATLRDRVDGLEVRTATLESQQFSVTTKLYGQAIVQVTDAFGGASGNGQEDNYNTTLSDRARLNLITSFTGRDLLSIRIQGTNAIEPRPITDTAPSNEARLGFQSGPDATNAGFLRILYNFPVGDRVKLVVSAGPISGFIDVLDNLVNPLLNDATGSISRFGRYSPIYRLSFDTGVAANINLGNNFKLEMGYLASEANIPSAGNGLFNGDYAALAQLVYAPNFGTFAFTYVNAYNDNGLIHGTGGIASNLGGRAVSSNSFGIEANFKVSPKFQVGGFAAYFDAETKTDVKADADIWTWAITLAFPDLLKKGNLGGIVVGMQPKLTGTSTLIPGLPRRDLNTGLHIEAFYRHAINDNLSITPGIVWLTAPNHNDGNKDIFLTVLRTSFSF
ncbi:iron uptake porin (plasmid) [Phormidium sp. CLA17]|uniref:iron uptake porin n=1 Tax=Leptolyngbya sp. Cla-17 TaxID=2803751 RepID=UPI00149295FE|nr:iron uptake porin [Leptolyngbya sp. Cla-17]MBM0745583.1 iron uptake porin [Leptolyngbya sp. Cla-17]